MKASTKQRITGIPVLGKIITNLTFTTYCIAARARESFPNIAAVLFIIFFVATAVFSLSFPQKVHSWVWAGSSRIWAGISYFGAGVVIVASMIVAILAIVFIALGFIIVGIMIFLVPVVIFLIGAGVQILLTSLILELIWSADITSLFAPDLGVWFWVTHGVLAKFFLKGGSLTTLCL